jgi:hypothetical protein
LLGRERYSRQAQADQRKTDGSTQQADQANTASAAALIADQPN